MCDETTFEDELLWLDQPEAMSRRGFAGMIGTAGLLSIMPTSAFAQDEEATPVTERDVSIKTPDGMADCYFVAPSEGRHPGVIIWPDIFGLRPAFRQMGKRLAQAGYAVLVVNPFYRHAKSPVLPANVDPRAPENWAKVRDLAGKLTPKTNVTDAKAFAAWIDKQKSVDRKRKMATMGYCMGGPMVIRTAAALPARIGAAATFHSSALVTDKPDSPHLLIPKMKASALIAIAENDDQKAPKEKDQLRAAFLAAKLPSEVEVYAGAMHGWCPPDGRAYNEAQAEQAWSRLQALLMATL